MSITGSLRSKYKKKIWIKSDTIQFLFIQTCIYPVSQAFISTEISSETVQNMN